MGKAEDTSGRGSRSGGSPDQGQRTRRIRWMWTVGNVVLAGLAVWSLTSDVWEAFITAFLASALLQLLWMRRNT